MRDREGGWKHTPRRRRAALRYAERGHGAWGHVNGAEDVIIAAGDYPEVAEDVHVKETFTHEP